MSESDRSRRLPLQPGPAVGGYVMTAVMQTAKTKRTDTESENSKAERLFDNFILQSENGIGGLFNHYGTYHLIVLHQRCDGGHNLNLVFGDVVSGNRTFPLQSFFYS